MKGESRPRGNKTKFNYKQPCSDNCPGTMSNDYSLCLSLHVYFSPVTEFGLNIVMRIKIATFIIQRNEEFQRPIQSVEGGGENPALCYFVFSQLCFGHFVPWSFRILGHFFFNQLVSNLVPSLVSMLVPSLVSKLVPSLVSKLVSRLIS